MNINRPLVIGALATTAATTGGVLLMAGRRRERTPRPTVRDIYFHVGRAEQGVKESIEFLGTRRVQRVLRWSGNNYLLEDVRRAQQRGRLNSVLLSEAIHDGTYTEV
jgi:hypothetical protein